MRALALFILLALGACRPSPAHSEATLPAGAPERVASPDGGVPYALAHPSAVMPLPRELREISGLAWLPSGRLAAVQDERGSVYELDPATGAILRVTAFHPSGDFESVAWDGAALWALESGGTLYRLVEGEPVQRLSTGIRARCDAEGVEWDGRRLLVACKEEPGGGLAGVRAVYAVDRASGATALAFTLDRRALDGRGRPFKPSALARHPATGELYVLSSVRQSLAVVAPDGRLTHVADLPRERLMQPEGLAFAPDGTLYVASEGHPSVLLRYDPIPTDSTPP